MIRDDNSTDFMLKFFLLSSIVLIRVRILPVLERYGLYFLLLLIQLAVLCYYIVFPYVRLNVFISFSMRRSSLL